MLPLFLCSCWSSALKDVTACSKCGKHIVNGPRPPKVFFFLPCEGTSAITSLFRCHGDGDGNGNVNESRTEIKDSDNKAFHFLILKNNNRNIRCHKVQLCVDHTSTGLN